MKPPVMKTEIHQNIYEVNIDFDSASHAWRENKVSIGNGEFIYKTLQTHPPTESSSSSNRYNLRSRTRKN